MARRRKPWCRPPEVGVSLGPVYNKGPVYRIRDKGRFTGLGQGAGLPDYGQGPVYRIRARAGLPDYGQGPVYRIRRKGQFTRLATGAGLPD